MSIMIFRSVQSDLIRHPIRHPIRSKSPLVDFRLLHRPPRFIPFVNRLYNSAAGPSPEPSLFSATSLEVFWDSFCHRRAEPVRRLFLGLLFHPLSASRNTSSGTLSASPGRTAVASLLAWLWNMISLLVHGDFGGTKNGTSSTRNEKLRPRLQT